MSAINVGSVTAEVVPDARGFKEKLDAALRGLEATVALKLVDEQVKAELDRIARDRTVTVEADVDTKAAEARLTELTRPRSARVHTDVDTSSFDAAGSKIGLLATSIIALAPAMIPVAAGAAAVGGALVGMGAAGILAFKGIQAEIKANTDEGKQYSSALNTLKDDLGRLEATAAKNVLGPFLDAVKSIGSLMPDLNKDIGMFAGQLGRVASSVLSGIISGFHTLSPLMVQVGSGIEGVARSFQHFASGTGLQKFGGYAASVLPGVGAALQSIATAALHIIEAFAPIGTTVLGALKSVADVINAIPVGVLSALASGFVSIVLGLKGMQIAASVAGGISKLSLALGGAALNATAMSAASAGIGAVLAIATFLWAKHEAAVQADKQAVQSMTDALIASKGAIDDTIRSQEAKNLLDQLSSDTLSKLHLTLGDATNAALGLPGAMDKVTAAAHKYGSVVQYIGTGASVSASNQKVLSKAAKDFLDVLNKSNSQFDQGRANAKAYAQAMADTAVVTGRTATSTLAAQAAKKLEASATKAQTAATNALNQAMDAEISKQATLAGGALAVDQAMLDLTTTLHKNKGAMSEHTQAGIDDRRAILGAATALQSQRDNLIKTGTASDVATRQYGSQAKQLLDNIRRTDGANSSAYRYAQQLLKIPKNVQTVIKVNTGGAILQVQQVQAAINALKGRSVPITVYQQNAFNKMAAMPGHSATGGYITGPGTSTSDSIPTMLSNGEYVIKADAVSKYGTAFMSQINAMRFAQGGFVPSRVAPAQPAAAAVGGAQATVHVYGAKGQSEREIGTIAAREIMWGMRV